MKSSFAVGVVREDGVLAVATAERRDRGAQVTFPATAVGVEAIRIFLTHCDQPVRLAVATIEMSLALGRAGVGHETFIVRSASPHQARALASYAAHAM